MWLHRDPQRNLTRTVCCFFVFSGTLSRSRFNLEGSQRQTCINIDSQCGFCGHQNQLRYKPTKTFQYTHFSCFHPAGVKRGFIKGDAIVASVASVSVWFRSKKRPWKGIFGYDRARNETRTKKWKRGPFFARSLTLVPHSLLLNRTEKTLATQANAIWLLRTNSSKKKNHLKSALRTLNKARGYPTQDKKSRCQRSTLT